MSTAPTTPPLEAGWGPATPVEDTLVWQYTCNTAASWEAIARAMGGRTDRSDDVALADLGRPTGMCNSATLLRPLAGADDPALDRVEAFYDGGGSGSVSLWSPWPTPDLTGRGWHLEGHPPLLARPPGPATGVAAPSELEIVEVDDEQGIEDWSRVAVEGFPFDECRPHRPGSLLDTRVLAEDRLRCFVGYVDGRAVCIGTLFVDLGLANFYLGVTLPEARRRGYWQAMAAHRIAEAPPDHPLAAVFSDLSRPGAQALGFWPLARFTLWTRDRTPTPSPTTPTTPTTPTREETP